MYQDYNKSLELSLYLEVQLHQRGRLTFEPYKFPSQSFRKVSKKKEKTHNEAQILLSSADAKCESLSILSIFDINLILKECICQQYVDTVCLDYLIILEF